MGRLLGVLTLGATLTCVPAFATITFVSSAFANNDFTNWVQLGPDGTGIPMSFSATSVSSWAIAGGFTGSGGGTVLVTPGSWPVTGGSFNSGDSLIWTGDSIGGTNGPLTLSFAAVNEVGLWIQADTPGAFTAQVQVFEGVSFSTFTLSSASGAPIFLGGRDSTNGALVTKVVYSLTACAAGCSTSDFAVDGLFLTDSAGAATPEPTSLALLGTGLLALAWGIRKRPKKSSED